MDKSRTDQFGLHEDEIIILRNLFDSYPEIEEVLVYGSRAMGNYSDRSDLDLVITKGELSRVQLGRLISEINESNFPYLVDIQLLSTVNNPDLLDHIRRIGKVF